MPLTNSYSEQHPWNIAAMDSKYKALASEYTKMRGQLTVLKRAVIDEQVQLGHLGLL